MRKQFFFSLLLALGLTAHAQQTDVDVQTGQFAPDWESLNAWECPEWFKDAKFGIWAHWGPQCHAEDGDWYARFMYYEGSGQNQWHYEHFGDPAEFGLKDLCNDWKAQNWNPEQLVNLYKSVGARYFMALGNHHDNFDLWNSPYQEWNSVNVGPKKDIIKGWSDACKAAGLPLGVSIHASHAWTWLEPSQEYDGNLTKEDGYKLNADGTEKWWKGMDPQELYAQRHEHSSGWENSGSIHGQWDWGNGANLPSAEYKQKFQNRVLEMINDYNPDMIYFDDTAMPFYGCDDEIGKNILTHYYNVSAAANGGTPNVVVTGKQLKANQKKYMMWDVERGIPDRMQSDYWQTCTCIGSWHYDQHVYQNNGYKSGATVVRMLVDIVSKNGNLLLSVPVKSDGTIDDKEEKILADIKAWMDINSESVYGTRTWKTFGEGPLADAVNPMNAQGFNEGQNYSSKDVRYVQKDGTIYATIMSWPASGRFSFKSFSFASEYYSGKVTSVKLLGYDGQIEFSQGIEGLSVMVPSTHPNEIAPVFAITVEETNLSAYEELQEAIKSLEAYIATMRDEASYINTGKLSTLYLPTLQEAVAEAKKVTEDASDAEISAAEQALLAAYNDFLENGYNKGGKFEGNYDQDVTQEYLVEASGFTRSEGSTRFGAPLYWTVENFNIPNGGDGVKAGLDNYSGSESLYLGLWNDRQNNTVGDLTNARIYRKINLPAGSYFFGAGFNTHYNISQSAYMFVASDLCNTADLPQQSIAFFPIADATEDKQLCGLWFKLEEDQEVYIGFQADLANGESCQEFRAEQVALYQLADANEFALEDLLYEIDDELSYLEERVGTNTGFYSREAWEQMRQLCDEWLNKISTVTGAEATQAYYAISEQWADFLQNGKNVGGAPITTGCEDITVATLHEANNFARTEDTDDGDRFGAPLYWTVENFGFGDQAGIDGIKGYDCLHLEVWWNNNAYADNGYDIGNVRLYQLVDLPAGRYFFGASYPSDEANDDLYIFASDQLLNTADIPSQAIAYEKVKLAAADGSFRGIYFTLEEDEQVYLGWQADFTTCVTNNLRASGVKLLRYSDLTYEVVQKSVADIEAFLGTIKVNNNTGYYSTAAYEKLMVAVNAAKQVDATTDFETLSSVNTALDNAYADFLQNGKNVGGAPIMNGYTDVTELVLHEADNFARTEDTENSGRFGAPLYWTVENFGFGDQAGIDGIKGYDCLHLEVWWNNNAYADYGYDISNVRLYQLVDLPAGEYYFGASYPSDEANDDLYIFASDELVNTADIPTQTIAYEKVKLAPADGSFRGLFFTLEDDTQVYLGWQTDFTNVQTNNLRASGVKLLVKGDGSAVGIRDAKTEENIDAPIEFFTLQGIRLNAAPQHGFFLMRQGSKVVKCYRK